MKMGSITFLSNTLFCMNFYDYEAEDARCNVVKMDDYKGKVVLVVNTATRCTNI